MFTCAFVEVLVVDDQTDSQVWVVHLVAVRVGGHIFTADGGGVRILRDLGTD